MISYRDIGERVRRVRQDRGLTQTELAKILGTSQTALSEIERGNRGLTVQQVVKICRALKTTPNEMLGATKSSARNSRPRNRRILRRLYRLEKLPEEQQRAALKILDGIIEAHGKNG